MSSQEESGLKNVMNSNKKITHDTQARLTQGIPWWAQANKQSNSSAGIVFKTDVCLRDMVSPNKLLSLRKDVGGRQWICSKPDYEWYWTGYGTRAENSKRRKKKTTLRNPTGERNLPNSCEKHSWANSCCAGTPSMQGIALETRELVPTNPCLNGLIFTMPLQPRRHPCRQRTHANTGGKKSTGKQIF